MRSLPGWTRFVQPAVAGLLIGIVAIWWPQVTGAGYEHIDEAMHDQYLWPVLALLGLLKILTTVTSFGFGTPGGLFAPTLFIGAMLGGAVCGAARGAFPWFEGSTGVYALIGMGTLFAGILRAPITSVFMIVEVSGNYSIVLPVMIANTIAYLISRQYQREALFDALAAQDGVPLPSMEQQRETIVSRVEDAVRQPAVVLGSEDRVLDAADRLRRAEAPHALARARRGAWIVVPADGLSQFVADGKGELAIGSVLGLAAPLPILHPDEPLEAALRRMGDLPFLPVVHRADPDRLIGIADIQSILGAYRRIPHP
jgi:CIC family chloride channel protein